MSALDDVIQIVKRNMGMYHGSSAVYGAQLVKDAEDELKKLRATLDRLQTSNAAWEITSNWYKAQLDDCKLCHGTGRVITVDVETLSDWQEERCPKCRETKRNAV